MSNIIEDEQEYQRMLEKSNTPATGSIRLARKNLSTLSMVFGATKMFQHIVTLDLSGNSLARLPSVLGQCCPSLRELVCYRNRISVVEPGLFSALPRLTTLYLSDNQLMHLPREIQRLQALRFLDLSSNQFREIPAGISLLPELSQLELGNNPLLAPYAAVATQGVPALQKFLTQFVSALSYEALQWMYNDRMLADATLVFEGRERKVHSAILRRELLFDNLEKDDRRCLTGSAEHWELVLQYLYTGSCTIEREIPRLERFAEFAKRHDLSFASELRDILQTAKTEQVDQVAASATESPPPRLGEKVSLLGGPLLVPRPAPRTTETPKRVAVCNRVGFAPFLLQLYSDHSRADMCIRSGVDNTAFPVHQLIVAAQVPLFCRMLAEGWRETINRSIVLPYRGTIIAMLVQYLYLGRISNTEETLLLSDGMTLLELARMYDVSHLITYAQIRVCSSLGQHHHDHHDHQQYQQPYTSDVLARLAHWSKFYEFSMIASQVALVC